MIKFSPPARLSSLVSYIVAMGAAVMPILPAAAADNLGTINPYVCADHATANYVPISRNLGFGRGNQSARLHVGKLAAKNASAGVLAVLNVDAKDKYFQQLEVVFEAQHISDLDLSTLGACYTDINGNHRSVEVDFRSRQVQIKNSGVPGLLTATTNFGLPANVIVTRVRVAITKLTNDDQQGTLRIGNIQVTTKKDVNEPAELIPETTTCLSLCAAN